MPKLQVNIGAKKTVELNQKITDMLMQITTQVLHKQAQVTAITLDYTDPEYWMIGGQSLAELNKSSFYLEIQITDETNTKAQKAEYIKEVYLGFKKILGDLHEASYVYVNEVRATAYGFGGLTQEYRYHHSFN